MTDKLVEQVVAETETKVLVNSLCRGTCWANLDCKKAAARIKADAEVIKAAEELAGCLQYADRRIAWEAHGLGNGFAERAEASLDAFRQAQQARAELEEKNDE